MQKSRSDGTVSPHQKPPRCPQPSLLPRGHSRGISSQGSGRRGASITAYLAPKPRARPEPSPYVAPASNGTSGSSVAPSAATRGSPVASASSGSSGSSSSTDNYPSGSSPPPSVPIVLGIDAGRFEDLVRQVELLTQQLARQQALNSQLQHQLQEALQRSTDLSLQLRTVRSKRTRSADPVVVGPSSGSTSDASMESADEAADPQRRRSTGRASPSNV